MSPHSKPWDLLVPCAEKESGQLADRLSMAVAMDAAGRNDTRGKRREEPHLPEPGIVLNGYWREREPRAGEVRGGDGAGAPGR